ncbi:MAG TPA: glycosyltransferase family 1 protein [Nitrospirales bacterium]|nr:glycosyltransferase family 1 protein [Nitrospirales bacterium]
MSFDRCTRIRYMRLRVLMISSQYPPIMGGAERQAQLLAQALVRKGCHVEILTQSLERRTGSSHEDGVLVHRSIQTLKKGKIFGLTYLMSSFWSLLCLRFQCDVIHCQSLYLDSCVAALMGKPVLGMMAGDRDLHRMQQMVGAFIWMGLIRRLSGFVAISDPIEKKLLAVGVSSDKIYRLPNGVDMTGFVPVCKQEKVGLRTRLQIPVDASVAIFCGRLAPEKNLKNLLHVWAGVTKQLSKAHLLLVGSGPEHAELERVARQLGLLEQVHFLGQKNDVLPYLQASDFFVLPSLREGCPNALLEAMAVGLPCVATRVGAIPELIDSGRNGILIDLNEVSATVRAIVQLVEDPEKAFRLGQAARDTVKERCSMDHIADQFIQIYKELLSKS